MNTIDFLIETISLISVLFFAAEFVSYCLNRSRSRKNVNTGPEQPIEPAETTEKDLTPPQELPENTILLLPPAKLPVYCLPPANRAVYYLPPARTQLSDRVVPFRRVQKLTDKDLIKLAKRLKYPGADRWSYKRKLTDKVRRDLLAAKVS